MGDKIWLLEYRQYYRWNSKWIFRAPVIGFNEDDYVLTSNANSRTIENLLTEYNLVRQSSIALYNSFNTNDLMQKGVAGSGTVSVRALGFLIAGHENHHCQVIKERYL